MPTRCEAGKFDQLFLTSIKNGAIRESLSTVRWEAAAGRCERPSMQELYSFCIDPVTGRKSKRYIHMSVKCRQCKPCLKERAYLWTTRAKTEIDLSSRTWFCTFTIAPEHRVKFRILASKKIGCRVEDLEPIECYKAIYNEISREFTKYLKRVRKNSKSNFRFIMVAEKHKDGFPHLHAFFHEKGRPIRKALLQKEWPFGYTTFKICDRSTVGYVTKYLSKQALARVRASLRYGTTSGIF